MNTEYIKTQLNAMADKVISMPNVSCPKCHSIEWLSTQIVDGQCPDCRLKKQEQHKNNSVFIPGTCQVKGHAPYKPEKEDRFDWIND